MELVRVSTMDLHDIALQINAKYRKLETNNTLLKSSQFFFNLNETFTTFAWMHNRKEKKKTKVFRIRLKKMGKLSPNNIRVAASRIVLNWFVWNLKLAN